MVNATQGYSLGVNSVWEYHGVTGNVCTPAQFPLHGRNATAGLSAVVVLGLGGFAADCAAQSRVKAKHQYADHSAARGVAPSWRPQGCVSRGCRSTPLMIIFASCLLRKAKSQTPRSFAQGKNAVKDS